MAIVPAYDKLKNPWVRVTDEKIHLAIITIVSQGLTIKSIIGEDIIADKTNAGKIFTDGRVNFLGVRNNDCRDTFNDYFYVYWVETNTEDDSKTFICYKADKFTTKPGLRYLTGYDKLNINGVVVIAEGWQEDIWYRGTHGSNPYNALRQYRSNVVNRDKDIKPMKIIRQADYYMTHDKNKKFSVTKEMLKNSLLYIANIYDAKKKAMAVDSAGVNLHRASSTTVLQNIGEYSAGCQVFANINHFNQLMNKIIYLKKNGVYVNKQKTFSYFLTNQKVFDKMVKHVEEPSLATKIEYDKKEVFRALSLISPYKYASKEYAYLYDDCGESQIGSSESFKYDWGGQESMKPKSPAVNNT